MPIKTRYILSINNNQSPIRGVQAIANVLSITAPHILKIDFPPNWLKKKKIEKMKMLAKYLPPGWVLSIIKEPKHTRATVSKYTERLQKRVLKEEPKEPLAEVFNRINNAAIDNHAFNLNPPRRRPDR